MKIELNPSAGREVVGFLDDDGDIWLTSGGICTMLYHGLGAPLTRGSLEAVEQEYGPGTRIYQGDTVTITF